MSSAGDLTGIEIALTDVMRLFGDDPGVEATGDREYRVRGLQTAVGPRTWTPF